MNSAISSRAASEKVNNSQLEVVPASSYILLAAAFAAIAKLLIAWNTIGTNDTIVFFLFGRELASRGLAETYHRTVLFNHPPLVAYYLHGIYQLSQSAFGQVNHISFPFLLRLPGIVADFFSTILVCKISMATVRLPFWALLTFALSPVSLMVSGFHGNTDGVMVLFVLLATLLTIRQRPLLAGLSLALSCQVKIAPLLLVPAFLFFWQKRRQLLPFALAFVAATLLFSAEPLLFGPVAYIKNVLGYGGYSGLWGISYILRLAGLQQFSRISFFNLAPAANYLNSALKVFVLCAGVFLAWRRRRADSLGFVQTLALSWLLLFIFAPGIAPQYFIWLVPFLLFISPGFFACFVAAATIFLFIFYHTICHGFPWYFGVSTNALSAIWAPWSLLPWLALIGGAALSWRSIHSQRSTCSAASPTFGFSC